MDSNAYLYIMIECLALGFGHYLTIFRKLLGGLANPWRIIFNYTYGVACIIGSFIAWLRDELPDDPHYIGWQLTGFTFCAGAVVAFAYFIDWLDRKVDSEKVAKIKNAHLERRRDGETDRTQ